jgi:2-polyprenyl-6-methoxyphenol hydroxylase-like FAD-dependent oxidoreductase
MPTRKPITIVGGGLAGLTLGIGLRQQEVPVVVWEAGQYPRHRVCGEFISGAGQRFLRKLELLDALGAAGARQAKSVSLFSNRYASGPMPLPEPALCLSRFVLDKLLAQRFTELGGELLVNRRWRVHWEKGRSRERRRAQSMVDGWRWIGLKAHARDIILRADLEMCLNRDGCVGVCQLGGGTSMSVACSEASAPA